MDSLKLNQRNRRMIIVGIIGWMIFGAVTAAFGQTPDQARYCSYVESQAKAQATILESPSLVAGITQQAAALPAQSLLGMTSSVQGIRKGRMTVKAAKDQCALYTSTTDVMLAIQFAPNQLESDALKNRRAADVLAIATLDTLINTAMLQADAGNLTRQSVYALTTNRAKLVNDTETIDTLLANLYVPEMLDRSINNMLTNKFRDEVEAQKSAIKLQKAANWDLTVAAGVHHQIAPFFAPNVGPYATFELTYNLGARKANRELEATENYYMLWKSVEQSDAIVQAGILRNQVQAAISANRSKFYELDKQLNVINDNYDQVQHSDTSVGQAFSVQLQADRAALKVELRDAQFRLAELEMFLTGNFGD